MLGVVPGEGSWEGTCERKRGRGGLVERVKGLRSSKTGREAEALGFVRSGPAS